MLLFLKAVSNGKPFYIIETTGRGYSSSAEALLAELVGAHPFISPRYPYKKKEKPERLLYAISEDGEYPTLWYFEKGYTRMRFNPQHETVEERYKGSEFVPLAVESGK